MAENTVVDWNCYPGLAGKDAAFMGCLGVKDMVAAEGRHLSAQMGGESRGLQDNISSIKDTVCDSAQHINNNVSTVKDSVYGTGNHILNGQHTIKSDVYSTGSSIKSDVASVKDSVYSVGNHLLNGQHIVKSDIASVKDAVYLTGQSVKDNLGVIKDAVYLTGQSIKSDLCEGFKDSMETTRSEGRQINEGVRTEGRFNAEVTRSEGRAVGEAVRDESRWLGSKVADTKEEVRSESRWLSDKIGSTKEAVQLEARFLNKEFCDTRKEIADLKYFNEKQTNFLNTRISDKTEFLACKITDKAEMLKDKLCDMSKDQWIIAKDAQLYASQNHADALRLADKHFAQLQLEAERNKCELAKQLAECCCEMRLMQKDTFAKIIEDGGSTRALIAANETQRLRDELALERQRVLLLSNPVCKVPC